MHFAQGSTTPNLIVWCGKGFNRNAELLYVALSRCTDIDNIVIFNFSKGNIERQLKNNPFKVNYLNDFKRNVYDTYLNFN